MKRYRSKDLLRAVAGVSTLLTLAVMPPAVAKGPISRAIFTTDRTCMSVIPNIYDTQADVYISGGPPHPGAAGLPDGSYYVQVTQPDGTLLGTSVGTAAPTPVHVTNGEFDSCYQLAAILVRASDGAPGYDETSSGGGEYKVWLSKDLMFHQSSSKSDIFKVRRFTQTGSIVIKKVTDPAGAGGSFPFVSTILGCESFSLADGQTMSCEAVPGGYQVQETDFTGFVPTISCDDSDSTDQGGGLASISLAQGETVTCTYTDTQVPGGTVVIKKVTVPGGLPNQFSFTSSISIPGCDLFVLADGQSTTCEVIPGTYSVQESPVPEGFVATIDCDDSDSTDLGGGIASIKVAQGETVICTFTNTAPVPLP
jgi:hypothetical protein